MGFYLMSFDNEGVAHDYQDYDFFDIKSNDEKAIVIHKKYIHSLCLYGNLESTVDFVPSNSLEIMIMFRPENLSKIINYI